mgnify:FL=1|tara:strand:- start:55 stop:462 length:408 start_codon:yes stop_codon:yes gene_type:complete
MKEVYLYFRTQASAGAGDDDGSDDSCMFPLSAFTGMHPTAADTLTLFFKPVTMKEKVQFDHDGDSTTSVKNDKVVVSLSTNDTHKTVIRDLARLFAGAANGGIHADGFISVADDQTSAYAISGISGLSTISVTAS